MKEVQKSELPKLIEKGLTFIFFFTPMCGTCQLGEKMLVIVEQVIGTEILKCNLNFAPELASQLEIESVPCLTVWKDGRVHKKIYAFHSVNDLYSQLKLYI